MSDTNQKSPKDLKEKIDQAKIKYISNKKNEPNSFGKVMKVMVEIVAAMAVGLGIGILIDNYFETRPVFIIVFFLLGSAAGILNVFRVAKSLQKN